MRAYVDYADQYPVTNAKKRAARDATLSKFGELGRNFNDWWERVGNKKFAEDGVPLITALSPSTVHRGGSGKLNRLDKWNFCLKAA